MSSFVYDYLTNDYLATIKSKTLTCTPANSPGIVNTGVATLTPWALLCDVVFFVANTTANYSKPRRSVGVSRTPDPTRWPQPTPSLVADEIDDRWASSAAARLQGNRTELCERTHTPPYDTWFSGDISDRLRVFSDGLSAFGYQTQYIGFLWVAHFGPGGPKDPRGPTDVADGTIEVEVVSSRDGQHWRRADPAQDGERPQLLPRGPEPWDAMMIHTSTHPLLVDGKLHLYFQGDSCSHHGGYCMKPKTPTGIGLAMLRRDGWASLAHNSTAPPGYVFTQPVGVGSGDSLRVNYKASAGGSLRVALYPLTGTAMPGRTAADCTPLTGDSTNQSVTWAGTGPNGSADPDRVFIKFVFEGEVELYSYSISQ